MIEPVRAACPGLCATLYDRVPLPVPMLPPVTVMNDELETPAHWQVGALAVTPTVPGPPANGAEALVGASVKLQGAVVAVRTIGASE